MQHNTSTIFDAFPFFYKQGRWEVVGKIAILNDTDAHLFVY